MHLPSLDLNLLARLAVLLRTCSVTATARKLGLSQPTVSRSLAQLRSAIGDPLLVRVGNRMCRTARGDALLEPVSSWLESAAVLIESPEFQPASLRRRFRIAATDFGVMAAITPALPAILKAAPEAAIDIVPLPFEPAAALAAGDIDLAVSGLDYNPAQLHGRALFTDSFACLMRPEHPLATGDGALALDQLLGCAHLGITVSDAEVERLDHVLGEVARARKVSARIPYFHAAAGVIAGSDLLMMLPLRAARTFARVHGLALRHAPAEVGTLHYTLLWHERSAQDPAVAWLADRLGTACHSSSE